MNAQHIFVGVIVAVALIFFIRRIAMALRTKTPDCGCGCGQQCKGKRSRGCHLT